MQKVNLAEVKDEFFASPKKVYQVFRKQISHCLRQQDGENREAAFEMEHVKLPPGKKNFPYHQHATWWELYYILSGQGKMRTRSGLTEIEPEDCFVFPPGDPHQIINDSQQDLVYLVIANNTSFDQCYYPDSDKVWFSGPVAKGQTVGLTQVKPGFTTNYWQDEE